MPRAKLPLRPPTLADGPATLALMLACDRHEHGLPDSDLADLERDWAEIDLSQDAWLAVTAAGQVVGYAAVLPWGKNLRYLLYTDPEQGDEALGRALLARCETRGTALAVSVEAKPTTVKMYIPHPNERHRRLVEQAGFQPVNYVFNFDMLLTGPLPAVEWPADLTVRTAIVGQDDEALHRLIQAAFARPGREPQTLAEWQASLMAFEGFDPTLWFVAQAGGEIVGACLCRTYTTEGWVRQLAVRADWRGRGLGRALLLHAFATFKQRGFERVGLAVEADNPHAVGFYQALGMRRIRQYDEYEKRL